MILTDLKIFWEILLDPFLFHDSTFRKAKGNRVMFNILSLNIFSKCKQLYHYIYFLNIFSEYSYNIMMENTF